VRTRKNASNGQRSIHHVRPYIEQRLYKFIEKEEDMYSRERLIDEAMKDFANEKGRDNIDGHGECGCHIVRRHVCINQGIGQRKPTASPSSFCVSALWKISFNKETGMKAKEGQRRPKKSSYLLSAFVIPV